VGSRRTTSAGTHTRVYFYYDEDRTIVLGWHDSVHGTFEIMEMAGDDGFVAFNHIDELTCYVRSNMGADGVSESGSR
jgi:hypothetical protein